MWFHSIIKPPRCKKSQAVIISSPFTTAFMAFVCRLNACSCFRSCCWKDLFWAKRGGRSFTVVRPGRKERREPGSGRGKNETWPTNHFISFLSWRYCSWRCHPDALGMPNTRVPPGKSHNYSSYSNDLWHFAVSWKFLGFCLLSPTGPVSKSMLDCLCRASRSTCGSSVGFVVPLVVDRNSPQSSRSTNDINMKNAWLG